MKIRYLFLILMVAAGPLPAVAQVENRSPLAIKDFMANNFIGQSPSQIQWSPDGKYLYFNWSPDGKPSDSVYRVDPANPVLGKAPRSVMGGFRSAVKQVNADKSL
jgi:hypothetical protein